MQWPNEPQVMNRIKRDNTMVFCSWLVVHLTIVLSVFHPFMTCGSFGHCIICLYSIHGLLFIWPLYYMSFFYSWIVVHLAITLSLFLLFMNCGSFGHCIISLYSIHDLWFIWEPQATNRIKTDNAMAKWTTSHE
jgi:hypothetical protein